MQRSDGGGLLIVIKERDTAKTNRDLFLPMQLSDVGWRLSFVETGDPLKKIHNRDDLWEQYFRKKIKEFAWK